MDIEGLRRHCRAIEEYERRRDAEATRFDTENADEIARLSAAWKRVHRAPEWATPGVPFVPPESFTAEERAVIERLSRERAVRLAKFDHVHRPAVEPWDTPARLLNTIDSESVWASGRAGQLLDVSGFAEPSEESRRREAEQTRDEYRRARARALAFARFDSSLPDRLREASDPIIGLQDVRAWAEMADRTIAPVERVRHDRIVWPDVPFVAATRSILPKLTDAARRRLRDEIAPALTRISIMYAHAGRADVLLVRRGPGAPDWYTTQRWAEGVIGSPPFIEESPREWGHTFFRGGGRNTALWDTTPFTAQTAWFIQACDVDFVRAMIDAMRAGAVASFGVTTPIDFAWLMAEALDSGDEAGGVPLMIQHAGIGSMAAMLAGRPLRWADDGEPGMNLGTRLCRIDDAPRAFVRAIGLLATSVDTPATIDVPAGPAGDGSRTKPTRKPLGRPSKYDERRDAETCRRYEAAKKAGEVSGVKEFARAAGLNYAATEAAIKRARAKRGRDAARSATAHE